MTDDVSGAPASGTGSHAAHEAPEGLRPSGFDPSRIGDEESDGEYVVCPACGYTRGDTWEWVKVHEREHECPGCGVVLAVWAEYDVTYYARIVAGPRNSVGSPLDMDWRVARPVDRNVDWTA